MIPRFMLVIALVMLISSPASSRSSSECEKGCTTTIVVTDCSGAAVEGATVKIKLCCNNGAEITASTDRDGSAIFQYCSKDICDIRINLQGFRTTSLSPNGCSVNGKSSRCPVRICAGVSSRP